MKEAFRLHLKSARELETPREAYRAGFVALALERNHRATPFVERARALKAAASHAKRAADLLEMDDIQSALLTAAGVSDKAASHLEETDKRQAISGLIREFLEPAGPAFVEELVYRFLLTRGDTIGGSMRNLGGVLAQQKLTRSVIAHLKNAGKSYRWLHTQIGEWGDPPEDETGIEVHLRGLAWSIGVSSRTLYYNVTVPVSGSHVDLSVLNCGPETLNREILKSPASFIALGELKGGIDPNGADEHWKTARTALSRINEAFARNQLRPHTFFIGAAIEPKMAKEMWSFLESGIIENAANLTSEIQVASLTRWLCSL